MDANTLSTLRAADDTSPPRPSGGLQRLGASTLGAQLAQRIAERIQRGALSPGVRLPSVREGARLHGVSPSTVVARSISRATAWSPCASWRCSR